MMSNEDEVNELARQFFSLWQEQCVSYVHQSDVVGATLRQYASHADAMQNASSKNQVDTIEQSKKESENHVIFDDATAGIFRNMVAQLLECGNGLGASQQGRTDVEQKPE